MKCDAYKAAKMSNTFIFLPAGKGTEEVPADILDKLGELKLFKTLELVEGAPHIAVDPSEAIANIEKNGFHLQGVKITSEIVTP
ncbi:MAG: hypothetical protein C0609_06820 [Deltaproteobacteria bacterium]|nr:MAG: hypothetical protein C0609_06820 [Deltaproteobacteria bacterium]